ncbi:MAG: fatty acid desaturase [Pseudomonadota bacterium]
MDYLDGLLNLKFWGVTILTLIFLQMTIASVTLYLHRDQAHRGVDLHPIVRHVMRFWLWLSTGMVTAEWVGVHRKHHAHCETEDDPHSPQVHGLKKVVFEGVELYRNAAKDAEAVAKFSRGTPDDWIERNLYARWRFAGPTCMALIDLALFGVAGITVFGLQMLMIPFFAAGVINGVGHHTGYRNFECEDASTNITPWGLWIGGEELHNNHHAFPSSARFSVRKWEFDIGWLWIQMLSAVGLAKVRRVFPKPVIAAMDEPAVDLETMRAIITNRMHVLRDYGKRVTLPVLATEAKQAEDARWRQLLRRARKLMIRSPQLLDDPSRRELGDVLANSEQLQKVHEFRERLRQMWSGVHSHERLVDMMREWCAEAEASGIRALEEFSARLRRYRMQTA